MNILVTIPHLTLLEPEGNLDRVTGVLSPLKHHNLIFAVPQGANLNGLSKFNPYKVYTFIEPGLGDLRIPYFLSLSRAYRKCIAKIISENEVDMLMFDFPWGLAAATKQLKTPLVCISNGVESDFSQITLQHFRLKLWPLTVIVRRVLAWVEQRELRHASFNAYYE